LAENAKKHKPFKTIHVRENRDERIGGKTKSTKLFEDKYGK
jgi:hypothetical protein